MNNFKKQVRRMILSTSVAGVFVTGFLGIHRTNDAPVRVTSAQTQTSVSPAQFINSALELPSVAEIENMTPNQLNLAGMSTQNTRKLYHNLSGSSRRNQSVIKWESYLTLKERATQSAASDYGIRFVRQVMELPAVSAIEKMSYNQLVNIQKTMASIRSRYLSLSSGMQKLEIVARWEGYLSVKEAAAQNYFSEKGVAFVKQVVNLPSVSSIKQMSSNESKILLDQMASIREVYNNLASETKEHADVLKWEHYLSQKENATENLDSRRLEDFLTNVNNLPTLSDMEQMSFSELEALQPLFVTTRYGYNQLSDSDKQTIEILHQEEELSTKEVELERLLLDKREEFPEDDSPSFNLQLFNEEFLVLVNAERNRLGIHSLYYEEGLQAGTDLRAEELIEIGGLRVNGVPHVRPDGSSWVGALAYFDNSNQISYASGENIAMTSYTLSHSGSFLEYLVSGEQTPEQALASKFYNLYSNSPGHYQNMIDTHHKGFAVSIGFDFHSESSYQRLAIYNTMIFSAEH